MLSQTKNKILEYLGSNSDSSTKQIIDYLGISKQAVARHLSELLQEGYLEKKGRPPRVYYSLISNSEQENETSTTDKNTLKLIQDRFILFTPQGEIIKGIRGFEKWCLQRNFDIQSKAAEYNTIVHKYDQYKDKNGLINATNKIKGTFKDQCFLDNLYYSEFSAYEIFGRTNIYSMLLYAKTAQNKGLILELLQNIKDQIINLIIREKFDAVGFIPPSVPRKLQLQKEFEKFLNLPLPVIKINKIQSDIIIAQKTLKDPQDRIENSIKSFVVDDTRSFQNILLIDDFVGSGSSLNFTAQKVRVKIKDVQKVIGFAICGTPNGVVNNSKKFEVVSEA
jgi:DNA-binding transcriptional ArsR family regulator